MTRSQCRLSQKIPFTIRHKLTFGPWSGVELAGLPAVDAPHSRQQRSSPAGASPRHRGNQEANEAVVNSLLPVTASQSQVQEG